MSGEFKVGQLWRSRGGHTALIKSVTTSEPYPIWSALHGNHYHSSDGRTCLGEGVDHEDDLIELVSDAEVCANRSPRRRFVSLSRTYFGPHGSAYVLDAIDDDGRAWRLVVGVDGASDSWTELTPLPSREDRP